MYNKILIALDGSELAKGVLPHLEAITQGCGVANVIFVRVFEPVHLPVATEFAGGGVGQGISNNTEGKL